MRFGTASFFENIYRSLFFREELSFFIALNKVIVTPFKIKMVLLMVRFWRARIAASGSI